MATSMRMRTRTRTRGCSTLRVRAACCLQCGDRAGRKRPERASKAGGEKVARAVPRPPRGEARVGLAAEDGRTPGTRPGGAGGGRGCVGGGARRVSPPVGARGPVPCAPTQRPARRRVRPGWHRSARRVPASRGHPPRRPHRVSKRETAAGAEPHHTGALPQRAAREPAATAPQRSSDPRPRSCLATDAPELDPGRGAVGQSAEARLGHLAWPLGLRPARRRAAAEAALPGLQLRRLPPRPAAPALAQPEHRSRPCPPSRPAPRQESQPPKALWDRAVGRRRKRRPSAAPAHRSPTLTGIRARARLGPAPGCLWRRRPSRRGPGRQRRRGTGRACLGASVPPRPPPCDRACALAPFTYLEPLLEPTSPPPAQMEQVAAEGGRGPASGGWWRRPSVHGWFSGRILACHAGGPGSIPGPCSTPIPFWSRRPNAERGFLSPALKAPVPHRLCGPPQHIPRALVSPAPTPKPPLSPWRQKVHAGNQAPVPRHLDRSATLVPTRLPCPSALRSRDPARLTPFASRKATLHHTLAPARPTPSRGFAPALCLALPPLRESDRVGSYHHPQAHPLHPSATNPVDPGPLYAHFHRSCPPPSGPSDKPLLRPHRHPKPRPPHRTAPPPPAAPVPGKPRTSPPTLHSDPPGTPSHTSPVSSTTLTAVPSFRGRLALCPDPRGRPPTGTDTFIPLCHPPTHTHPQHPGQAGASRRRGVQVADSGPVVVAGRRPRAATYFGECPQKEMDPRVETGMASILGGWMVGSGSRLPSAHETTTHLAPNRRPRGDAAGTGPGRRRRVSCPRLRRHEAPSQPRAAPGNAGALAFFLPGCTLKTLRAPPSRTHAHGRGPGSRPPAPGSGPGGPCGSAKGRPAALAGNRTRVNCLEGSYAHHYTTNAAQPGPPRDAGPGLAPAPSRRRRCRRPAQPCPDAPPARSSALPQAPPTAAPRQTQRPSSAGPTASGGALAAVLRQRARPSPSPPAAPPGHFREAPRRGTHPTPDPSRQLCSCASRRKEPIAPATLAGPLVGRRGEEQRKPSLGCGEQAPGEEEDKEEGRRVRVGEGGQPGHESAACASLEGGGGRRRALGRKRLDGERCRRPKEGVLPPRRGIEPRSPA
ncbi:basic proline-rich protein-like [Diceros bicornis minor]|uniref:basic proline-rich protein-like n=1 Tax=Diceros bicornis minor TaxID=77932 RepID=UPI0026F21B4B|nr:basic proline-rich protein-like [Diceros bicornis minor]